MAKDASTDVEIERKFWKALRADATVMLGLRGVDEDHSQPMTAQLTGSEDQGPLWFFTTKDTGLVRALGAGHRAQACFVSSGHELFACVHGQLVPDQDRSTIDQLWNPFVAAWYEDGKDDPKLQLLRFDPERAQIWLNEHSLVAGVQLLLGRDPKKLYEGKVAEVSLKN